MVLIRLAFALALLAGCKQSLFDNNGDDTVNGDGSTGGDGIDVPSSCPMTCLGDAAADFGMPKWAYLDDRRTRTWAPMTQSGMMYVGADPANTIAKCPASGGPSACNELPGALLVSTAGATSDADPAFAYTATTNQVIQLSLRVHVPSGASAQQVRLYRNSREDILHTGTALPGTTFEQAIIVDAIANDRFLLAIAPTAMGAQNIAVHFFVSATGAAFPSSCQQALSFSAAAGNTVANACGAPYTSRDYNGGTVIDVPPTLGAGPFPELGMAADLVLGRYYGGADVLVKNEDTTTQLWIRHDAFDPSYSYNAFAWSDVDLDVGGGLAIVIFEDSGLLPNLGIHTYTAPNAVGLVSAEAAWPNDHAWHFVRVVHAAGQARLCIDGVRVASFAAAPGTLKSTYAPRVGRNVVWTPSGAFFDGGIDDVRMFTGALPCE